MGIKPVVVSMNFYMVPLFLVLYNRRLPYSVNTVFSICSFLVVQWLFSARVFTFYCVANYMYMKLLIL